QDTRGIQVHLTVPPDLALAVASQIVDVRAVPERAGSDPPFHLDGQEQDGRAREAREMPRPPGMGPRVEEPEVRRTVVRGTEQLELRMEIEVIRDDGGLVRQPAQIHAAQRRSVADDETALTAMSVPERLEPATLGDVTQPDLR